MTDETPDDTPRPARRRRWLRVFGLVLGGLLLLTAGFVAWVLLTSFAEPPPLDGTPALAGQRPVTEAGGLRRLGPCWFLPREGASLLYLEGDPWSLGYANAALTSDRLEAQERALFDTVRTHLSNPLAFWGVAFVVLLNNRSLPEHVTLAEQLEIRGLAEGSPADPFPQYGSRYHRILNYHAAHDISHWVWDRPVLGCTAFAASGPATADGQLLVGRNFDWEAGEHFDRNKVIAVVRPDEGLAFLSVAWPGMAGAVTGLNEAGVWCSVNGAHSERMGTIGRPVSLVVRDVLQHADSLDEAVRIVREADVFVADAFLLAEAGAGRAVVVEKAPGVSGVRELDEHGLLRLANHFESEAFADDAGNAEQRRVGTSEARQARLDELLREHAGALDVASGVDVLRDRAGPGGAPRAPGHRATINPMIATHSALADLDAGILWVSRGPHQLGPFEAWRLADFDGSGPPESAAALPADPALADGTYARLVEAREARAAALALLGEHDADALALLDRADELVPGHPQTLMLRADVHAALGDAAAADADRRAALAAEPPFAEHREALEAALRQG